MRNGLILFYICTLLISVAIFSFGLLGWLGAPFIANLLGAPLGTPGAVVSTLGGAGLIVTVIIGLVADTKYFKSSR